MTLFNDLSWPLLAWSGVIAYLLSNWLLMLFRKLNATRYLPRAYWSCALMGGAGTAALAFAGLVRMLAMLTLFPVGYAVIFRTIGAAEVLPGFLIGLAHGALAGLVLPLAARRCRGAHPPGLFGWNLGRLTPLVLVGVHGVYGAILGYVYVLVSS